MKRMMIAVATLVALMATALPVGAQSSDVETLTEKEVPATVTSRMRCKAPSGPMTRRVFASGYVFTQSCTDGETLVRVVYATGRDGAGARILQFHRPEGRRMSALASIEFKPAEGEVSGTTGRLPRRICRAEGRWRMEGKQPTPGLIFWRQTADCEGKTGWQTTVNRRK